MKWDKELRLYDASRTKLGTATFRAADLVRPTEFLVGRFTISQLTGGRLVFSRQAGPFGFWFNLYELRMDGVEFFQGKRVLFTWKKD
jgi:hypothetical protein